MKNNDKILMAWHKRSWKILLLSVIIFTFSFTQVNAQCEWTVEVTSSSLQTDEISWELTDADGNIVLQSDFNTGIIGSFTADATGPLDFHISTQGTYNDNEADYSISNGIEEVASGHLEGGEEVTENGLECAVLEDCVEAYAGEAMDDFSICEGEAFMLETQDVSFGEAGLSYQWEESENGDDWSDIEGATSKTYTVSDGIENSMAYRLTVSCEFGGSDTSNSIEVSINDILDCYCIPIYTVGCSTDKITNVSLSGESESIDNDSECSVDAYGDYTDLTPADLAPGETYTLSVSTDIGGSTYKQVRVWIDYNLDGQFSEDEEIANTQGGGLVGGTRTFEFTIPDDIDPDNYRMRVKLVNGTNSTFDACEDKSYGETEDYIIAIMQLGDCEGTPTAGTIDEDFSVCSNSAFTISVSGASDPANGLERVWQSSPSGEDNWTDIDGANSTIYSSENGIEEQTDFRYKVTCSNSNETDVSNVITVSLNPAIECYCTPVYSVGCSSGDRITNVSLSGETEAIDNDSECSNDGYGDYTDLTPADLAPGETYTLNVSTDYGYPQSEQVRAWIDYNQDGEFSDEEEIGNSNGDGLPDNTGVYEFTVPEDAAPNEYRMRVRMVLSGGVNFDACSDEGYGETEDYTIEIVQLNACQGTPIAGAIEEDDFSICAGNPFSISVTGASDPAGGLERIWQSAPAGEDDWMDIDGESSTTYSANEGVDQPTDFRYKVTCTNSDEIAVSDVITVSLNPDNECYCTPIYSTGCSSGDRISNINLVGESATIDNDSGCSDNGYGDYTDLTPADLTPGESYTLSVSTDFVGASFFEQIYAWIDYNKDGQFTEDEKIASTEGMGMQEYTETFEFTVPENMEAGNYRMRIRLVNGLDYSDFDSCSSENRGETEDYTIELLAPPACLKPSDLMFSYVTDISAIVSWEPNNEETAWEVIYGESGFDPSEGGTVVAVEGNPQTMIEGLEQDTYYEVYVRAICSEEDQSALTGPESFTTFITPSENNYLCGAIALTANDGCIDGPYTNLGAFQEMDEPIGSCLTNFHGTNTVWFSFIGPSNGEAMITTDFQETEFNTEMVVYEAPTDCDDLNTLGDEVGCASSSATVELTDLTPGNIYYVQVAGFNNEEGEFCIEVQTDGDTPEPCPAPFNIFAEVGEMSVDVTWTSGGNENQWMVIYGETGFNPDDQGETVMVTGTPETTLTDLEPLTDYEVYVMAICEDGNTSDIAGPESFTSGDMSVDDYLFEDFTYYPNPVKDQLTLKAGTQIESVTVYNLLGQTVLTENPNQLQIKLFTNSLQSGVYLMKVTLSGSEKTFRVVKK